VESGTVIEDSSVLANTNVGICLDVCHAVVNGGKLFNLERDVIVEISDSRVMRSTKSKAPLPASHSLRVLSSTGHDQPLSQAWQMENI
jgi:hypothetical protein